MAPVGPSDRVQLTQYPPLPSKCALCFGQPDGIRVFIDFALQIRQYGSVNFCIDCCRNIGESVDMVLPEKHSEVVRVNQSLQDELALTTKELIDVSGKLDSVRAVFGNNVDELLASSVITNTVVESNPSTVEQDSSTEGSTKVGSGNKSSAPIEL